MPTSNNTLLIISIVLNFIFFIFNFYEGVRRSDWISLIFASASMAAILFCVWVMGYKHSIKQFEKVLKDRRLLPDKCGDKFIEIHPAHIKKSDIDRFVTKKVGKTKQQEWKKYQNENK